VAVGFTVTAVPLEAAMLPGVMTPAPLANTPVNEEPDPVVMEAGLAVKLEIEAGGVVVVELPPPQPVKAAEPRRSVMAKEVKQEDRFMDSPRCVDNLRSF